MLEVVEISHTCFVHGRLDYCNAVLAGIPASTLAPLQHPQNAAARLAPGLDRRSHTKTYNYVRSLVTHHIDCLMITGLDRTYYAHHFIFTIMHQTFHHRCPSYLSDLVVFALADSNVRQLRSSTTRAAAVKRSRTQFGGRAFSVAGPTYGTVSPPPSVRMYHRLPPSLPSCAQDTSVPLSI